MAITPSEIEQLAFSSAKHGYSPEEVDAFLENLAGEVDTMLQKIADLKGRLTNSESQLAAAQSEVDSLHQQLAAAQSAPAATFAAPAPVAASTSSATEHQISQALIVAQQSADRIVSEAKEAADSIREEADTKAREVIRQALAEKQNELDEIDRLKASREDFRSEYKTLLQHFMDDAESAFPNQVLSSVNGSAAARRDTAASTPVATPEPAAPVADVQPAPFIPAPDAGMGLDDLD